MPEENDALKSGEATPTGGVEQPQGEGAQQPATPLDELKAFIEARGIKSPDDFSDYIQSLETAETWKKKYGNSQNELGELRRELERLKSQVEQPNYSQNDFDLEGQQPMGQPLDLGTVVRKEIETVFEKLQRQQAEAARKFYMERSELSKRPGWKEVQPYFDKALQNPEVQMALQAGTLTQERLYNQINERVLMSKINSFVQNLPEGAVGTAAPAQNAETSDRITQPLPEQEARKQRITKAIENQDVDSLLKDLIPDDDPIVKF